MKKCFSKELVNIIKYNILSNILLILNFHYLSYLGMTLYIYMKTNFNLNIFDMFLEF